VSPGDRVRLEAIVADRNNAVTLNAMLVAGYEVWEHMPQPVPACDRWRCLQCRVTGHRRLDPSHRDA